MKTLGGSLERAHRISTRLTLIALFAAFGYAYLQGGDETLFLVWGMLAALHKIAERPERTETE